METSFRRSWRYDRNENFWLKTNQSKAQVSGSCYTFPSLHIQAKIHIQERLKEKLQFLYRLHICPTQN